MACARPDSRSAAALRSSNTAAVVRLASSAIVSRSAAACLICLAVIGGLYGLLWTLLVYEGGIFLNLKACTAVLFTSRTMKDFGYEAAPYAMGAFAGWMGNIIALALFLLLVWALFHLYQETARKRPPA